MISVGVRHRRLATRAAGLDPAAVERARAAHPVFQNLPYPLVFPPLVVEGARLPGHRRRVESYVALLGKIIRLYRTDREVRRFFGIDSIADTLVRAEDETACSVEVCRLDGYVDPDTGAWRLLENNADCPAGTLFTSRLNRFMRALLGSSTGPPTLPMDDADPFTATLLGGVPAGRCITAAVLQVQGKSNRESEEVAAALRAAGHACEVIDPRELTIGCDGLVARERRLDVVWNKINTAAWVQLCAAWPVVADVMARACQHTARPRMLNSFGARYVAEAKTSLALLWSGALADRFTPAELRLGRRLVPWTALLHRGAEVEYEGTRWPLATLARVRQRDLVLKQRYDIRGDGVTIGRSTAEPLWRERLAASWDTGAVLQRHVVPSRYPILRLGEAEAREENVSLDSFVFDGRLVGLGAKASPHDRVNVFLGGSKLPVVVDTDVDAQLDSDNDVERG